MWARRRCAAVRTPADAGVHGVAPVRGLDTVWRDERLAPLGESRYLEGGAAWNDFGELPREATASRGRFQINQDCAVSRSRPGARSSDRLTAPLRARWRSQRPRRSAAAARPFNLFASLTPNNDAPAPAPRPRALESIDAHRHRDQPAVVMEG